MAGHERYQMTFRCSALASQALFVVRVHGREGLSRLFEYEVTVRHMGGTALAPEDLTEILGGTATLAFGPDHEHPVHGVVRRIEALPSFEVGMIEYRMKLVPKLWDLCRTRGSWIYQNKTPKEILEAALTETPEEPDRLAAEDFELAVEGEWEPREYVVQYEESHLDFLSRQAEHWGIFYYFTHGEERSKVVFADSNECFEQLPGFEEIVLDPESGRAAMDESLSGIGMVRAVSQRALSLREHNYRIPSVGLVVATELDERGVGKQHTTGEHFLTPEEGEALLRLRAEESAGAVTTMWAEGRVRGLRAGHRFLLTTQHPAAQELLAATGLGREYLVTEVEHRYALGHESLAPELGDDEVPYSCRLTLRPAELPFRPPRITPKPKIHGIMHAKVDAEGDDDGVSAPVDEWGRYKVLLPFDVAGKPGGKASCRIRVITASHGPGGSWGASVQIHRGVEVAVAHIDGDPDRPVIVGSLPNFEHQPVVTDLNADSSVYLSRSGLKLWISDGK